MGTDFLEQSFAASRAKNPRADCQGTNGQMANIGGNVMQNLVRNTKTNMNSAKTLSLSEVEAQKNKEAADGYT